MSIENSALAIYLHLVDRSAIIQDGFLVVCSNPQLPKRRVANTLQPLLHPLGFLSEVPATNPRSVAFCIAALAVTSPAQGQ